MNWPEGAATKESIRAVLKLPRLQVNVTRLLDAWLIGSSSSVFNFLSHLAITNNGSKALKCPLLGLVLLSSEFVYLSL